MRFSPGLFLAAAAVLISNGAALAHVWLNRSSVESEVVLTEREMPKVGQEQDDTGVSLRFEWANVRGVGVEDWLNGAKLRELGFDVGAGTAAEAAMPRYYSLLPRPVFVALEYDGLAWQRYRGFGVISRLVPIDASLDAGALRARHSDRSRVLIVSATVRVISAGPGNAQQIVGLTGALEPLIAEIHVPLPLSRSLDSIQGSININAGPSFQPRYEVHLRFGAHHEPWVESVTLLR